MLDRLEDAFQAEVFLLPWDVSESYGHSDGMVAWIDDGRILLNNYHQLERGKNKPFTRRIRKILCEQFDVVELEYEGHPSRDSWCYLNFLETDDAIILPALSLNHESEEDEAALSQFQHIFPNKVIKQVYAKPLIRHGGALHCATWNHYLL